MDPNERRELVRDSCVHVLNSDEDNSFEDAEENPDPLVVEAALVPIPEEAGSNSSDSNEEEEEEEEDNQAGQNMPPQVDPNVPGAIQPQQLNALLQFDGNRGEAFVIWIECLETAKDTYNWAENSLVQVVKAKGGAAIAEWDRGNRLRGIIVNQWAGDNGFRAMLYKWFGPKYTSATTVNAVSDLKQRSRKSCAQFLDRVVLAVNKQNFNVGEVDKQTEVYKAVALWSRTTERYLQGCFRICRCSEYSSCNIGPKPSKQRLVPRAPPHLLFKKKTIILTLFKILRRDLKSLSRPSVSVGGNHLIKARLDATTATRMDIFKTNAQNPDELLAPPLPSQNPDPLLTKQGDVHNTQFKKKKKRRRKNSLRNMNLRKKTRETNKGD